MADRPADLVSVSRDNADGVVVLTLTRPERANALDSATVGAMRAAVDCVAGDDAVGGVVVAGAGAHFSAGMDLKEVARPPTWFDDIRALFDAIAALSVPTIAAVHGACLGGGAELALSCDLRVGDTTTRLGFPEIRLGALPVAGGTQRLTRLVGRAETKYLLWTGEPVDAAEAHRLGFLQEVVTAGGAEDRARELAGAIAGRPQVAVRMAKRLVDGAGSLPLSEGLAAELAESGELFADLATRAEQARETDPLYRRLMAPEHASSSIRDTEVRPPER
jgi:enoyl-CoA hydratase/carnithine racemase